MAKEVKHKHDTNQYTKSIVDMLMGEKPQGKKSLSVKGQK